MPASISRVVDVRTAPISERIAAMNDFYAAGYEVNINLGPIIYYEHWLEDYQQLFEQIDATLSPSVKQQLQAEVIFLTHNEELHKVNLQWHPKAEALLWKPELQEAKVSQAGGGQNLRYKLDIKRGFVNDFRMLLKKHLPYCTIRYAF
jgi:DNA repair photolyase